MVCLDKRSVDVADYVSLVVHLGTLHLDGLDRFAVFRSQFPHILNSLPAMSSCECHGLQHYADALGFNLCVSLVVHLGTLHVNGLIVFAVSLAVPACLFGV